MTDRKKPPSQELLPPERSTAVTRTVTPMPGGAIDSWTSGFVERIRAVAIRHAVDRHTATLDYINIDHQINEALKRNLISRADLQDIDNIVNEHLRISAFNRSLAQLRDGAVLEAQVHAVEMQARQAELEVKNIQQQIWDVEREHERRRQKADSLEVQEHLANQRAEADAQRLLLSAERDRDIMQMVNDTVIQTKVLIAQTTEHKTRYEYLQSLAVLRLITDPAPTVTHARDNKLDRLIEEYENLKNIAMQANDREAVGSWEMALATAKKLRDQTDK